MSDDPVQSTKRVLEPSERIAEVLFGLIMVLTFTGSLRVATAGPDDVQTMLASALGCNVAWGVIDAVFYCMASMAEKGRALRVLQIVRRTTDPQKAQRVITDALPSVVTSILRPSEIESIHQRLQQLPEPAARVRLRMGDFLAAFWVFLLVFLSTLPVSVPFIFIHNTALALQISNAIAILMLFGLGYAYGRCILRNPWVRGIVMVILGLALVALTIALGG